MPENAPRPLFRTGADQIVGGVRRVESPAVPAAGSEWSDTVPGGRKWRILSGTAILTTDATVANREIGTQASIAGVQVWRNGNGTAVTAGLVQELCYLGGLVGPFGGPTLGVMTCSMPGYWMPAGTTFGSATVALDAGDQYTSIHLFIEDAWEEDQDIQWRSERDAMSLLDSLSAANQTTGA